MRSNGSPDRDRTALVDIAAQSHQGRVRKANEDHYLVMRFGRTLETLLTSLPPEQVPVRAEEAAYGMLVADGVGGAAAGEMASRLALSTLVGLILDTPDWILSDKEPDIDRVIQRLADLYRSIHAVLLDEALGDRNLAGMGTTMTFAGSLGASAVIGHIGDSRAYLFRDGKLHQLTRDHTWVQTLVDRKQISAAEAVRHPMRHVLIRSLGGQYRSQVLAQPGLDIIVVQLDGAIFPRVDPTLAARGNHQIAGGRTLPAAAAINLPGGWCTGRWDNGLIRCSQREAERETNRNQLPVAEFGMVQSRVTLC
jgi:protein phosphatase